jgi:hypothetical protein
VKPAFVRHGVACPFTANASTVTPAVRYSSLALPARLAPGLWMLTMNRIANRLSVSGLLLTYTICSLPVTLRLGGEVVSVIV